MINKFNIFRKYIKKWQKHRQLSCFFNLYVIKLRIKSEIWKSWAKILIGRRFRQYPQKV